MLPEEEEVVGEERVEEEKEEKENAKIRAQPGPGTIKDKKTN